MRLYDIYVITNYFFLVDCSQWYRVSKANLKRAIKIMNLFRKESALSQMDNAELVAIKATRFYMILLSISVVIVAVFGSIDQKTVSEILPFPSLEMYEQLQVKYPNTLSCTCQQISILYKTFVSVTPKIHQVRYCINLCHLQLFCDFEEQDRSLNFDELISNTETRDKAEN